jgi:hypothetical protein
MRKRIEARGGTYLIASITKITLHLILSFPFRLDSISIKTSRYVKVESALLALLYIGDRSVQYRVYRICSLGGGKSGTTLGAEVDAASSVLEVGDGPVNG